jgi:Viral BACON domain
MEATPDWLYALNVTPLCPDEPGGCLNIPLNGSATFSVMGDFRAKTSIQGAASSFAVQKLIEHVAGRMTSAMSTLPIATDRKALNAALVEAGNQYLGDKAGRAVTELSPPPLGSRSVPLTSETVYAVPNSDSNASLTLACGSTPATATGTHLTTLDGKDFPSDFSFYVRYDSLLLFNTVPQAHLHVSVSDRLSVSPADDFTAIGQQASIPASSKSYTLTNTGSPTLSYTVGVTYDSGSGASWLSVSTTTGSLTGYGSTVVTVSVNSAASSFSPGTYTGKIIFSGGGTTITRNATLIVNSFGACGDISGNWNGTESGSLTISVVSTVESDSETDPVSGNGAVVITQNGCSIRYNPIAAGLISSNLTPSQLASLARTGTITGTTISVTGLFALVDEVTAAANGVNITSVKKTLLTANGQLSGSVIELSETADFEASGNFSGNGQSGTFTVTATSSSTATLTRSSMATPSIRKMVKIQISSEPFASSPGSPGSIEAMLRKALGLN